MAINIQKMEKSNIHNKITKLTEYPELLKGITAIIEYKLGSISMYKGYTLGS